MAVSTAFTSAGTTIGVVSGLPATHDQAGFAAQTHVLIGEVTNADGVGRAYNLVTHNNLADRQTTKRKGSYNDGAMTLQMARDPSDAGQAILVAGVDSDTSHSFEVTLQDGTILYFTAQIMDYQTTIGAADAIVGATVTVELDNSIVEV